MPTQQKDTKPILQLLQVLIQACPLKIKACALVLKEQSLSRGTSTTALFIRKIQQDLVYQLTVGSIQLRVEFKKNCKTILAPIKEFNRLVSKSNRIKYRHARILLQRQALQPLIVKAIAQHYFYSRKTNSFSYLLSSVTRNLQRLESRQSIQQSCIIKIRRNLTYYLVSYKLHLKNV